MTRTSVSAAARSTEPHTSNGALRGGVCAALVGACLVIALSQSACASSETLTKGPYEPETGGASGSNPGGNGGSNSNGATSSGGTGGDTGVGGSAGNPSGGSAQGGSAQGGSGAGGGSAGAGSGGGAGTGNAGNGGDGNAGTGGTAGDSSGGSAGSSSGGSAGSSSGGSAGSSSGGSAGSSSGGCASVSATSVANSCNGQPLPSGYSCWNVSGVNGATGNDSNPACGGGGLSGQDLVFSFVAPQSGQVYLSLTGPFEKAIYVMLGSCTNQPIQCVRRTDFATANTSFIATSGDTFYVFVDSTSDGEWGAFDLSISY
ncbi:MAG: hypothetical protein AB7K71_25025 [Polyangiaceae bacterium]